MITIGIDSRLTHYRVGGTSTYIRALLNALSALHHEQRYTIFHSRKETYPQIGDFVRQPLWTPCHHRLERLALSIELARFRLDVFHSPDFIPPYRGAKAHVITVHDLTFIHYPQYLTDDSKRYYNAQIEVACHHADEILVVSEATRHDLMTMLSVPAAKITVQPHGVDHRMYRPLSPAEIDPVRRKFGLPERYLLFVGTLEPRKNIDGLLKAYQLLKARVHDVPPLLLVGRRGWLIDDTLKRIEHLPNVWVIDDADVPDLPAIYNGATALILPAFYEGFGLPALEAMACGTVPIVSGRSSLPEVVGEVGLQINPDDPMTIASALAQILSADSVWLCQQREMALQRAALFTWERSAKIAQAVYTKAAKRV